MKKIISSVGYAIQGIKQAFKTELNFKLELACTVLCIVAGYYFKLSANEWSIVFLTIGLVLSMELINTAIEKTCNLYSTEKNNLIKQIKDISAAGTFIATIVAFIVGAIIFLPKILK